MSSMIRCSYKSVVAMVLCLGGGSLSSAQVEVLVSTAGPTSDIGVANDTVSFMYSFDVSPDGSWWAEEFELDNTLDSVHVRGSGASPSDVIWQESTPAPGGLTGTIRRSNEERQISVNNLGQVVGLARNRDQGTILGDFVYGYDGQNLSVVAATGMPVPALPMVNYGTMDAFVPDFSSPNVAADGSAGFAAKITGPSVDATNDLVTLTQNGTMFGGPRTGDSVYDGSPLQDIDDDQYFLSPASSTFLFNGHTTAPTVEDDVIVVGSAGTSGSVVLRENTTPITTSNGVEPFDAASRVFLAPNGDWYVAGDTTASTEILIRNGQVLVTEGDASPDGFTYTNEPIAFTADDAGNYAWIWQTTNPDPDQDTILVYNGTEVLLTEGDVFQFDQNGDGMPQPALIEQLFLDERNLSLAGGHAYLMAEVDEPDTTALIGWTFLRVPVATVDNCDFDGDAMCNVMDLNLLLAEGPLSGGVPVTVGVNDRFDMNSDGVLDLLDRDEWLLLAATEHGFASAYKLGDANLDGVVDGADFLAWNANKFTASLAWDGADFNGDGIVDGADFIIWNANKFMSSDVAFVPEPATHALVFFSWLFAWCQQGRDTE